MRAIAMSLEEEEDVCSIKGELLKKSSLTKPSRKKHELATIQMPQRKRRRRCRRWLTWTWADKCYNMRIFETIVFGVKPALSSCLPVCNMVKKNKKKNKITPPLFVRLYNFCCRKLMHICINCIGAILLFLLNISFYDFDKFKTCKLFYFDNKSGF